MSAFFGVVFGGALGAVLRYILSEKLKGYTLKKIAAGTLFINLMGSLLLGWLTGLQLPVSHWLTFFLTTGICGAFTTFSTFIMEWLSYMQKQDIKAAFCYVLLTATLCPLFFMLGHVL